MEAFILLYKKNIKLQILFCKTGLYILIIIINIKLPHGLKSFKHEHVFLFSLYTYPVNIHYTVSTAKTNLSLSYRNFSLKIIKSPTFSKIIPV